MCDTLIALGNATEDGSVIFAKNSDREPNEAHELIVFPAADHAKDETVHCTYIDIPQVPHTYAVFLAKPFWIWGAEMGANERGVVIGNEAVFTKVPYEKKPGLIGMDFLRLALERAATARSALDIIVQLLEAYGQGGNCGFTHPFYYHNSFLIGDPGEAWVLETAGRQWAAEKVKDVRSISNAITIGNEWDLASRGLIDYALNQGWCKNHSDFDFGKCYSDTIYTRFGAARHRQACSSGFLTRQKGKINVENMMNALREHGDPAGVDWDPGRGVTGAEVCMHVGFGPVRINQTTGSMVSRLTPDLQTHWVTGTAAPCTGIFKPVWVDAGLPDLGPAPKGTYDPATLWWRHEMLHREVVRNFPTRIALYQDERNTLEKEFISTVMNCHDALAGDRLALSTRCFQEASEATDRWMDRVAHAGDPVKTKFFYQSAWKKFNQQAEIKIS